MATEPRNDARTVMGFLNKVFVSLIVLAGWWLAVTIEASIEQFSAG